MGSITDDVVIHQSLNNVSVARGFIGLGLECRRYNYQTERLPVIQTRVLFWGGTRLTCLVRALGWKSERGSYFVLQRREQTMHRCLGSGGTRCVCVCVFLCVCFCVCVCRLGVKRVKRKTLMDSE